MNNSIQDTNDNNVYINNNNNNNNNNTVIRILRNKTWDQYVYTFAIYLTNRVLVILLYIFYCDS